MTTPLMKLTLPDPSVTPGPDWAEQLNAALEKIDSHDHSTNNGAKISQAGINLTGDLSFQSFGATNLNRVQFAQSDPPIDNDAVFVGTDGALKWKTSSGIFTILDATGSAATVGGFTGDYASTDAQASYSDLLKSYSFLQDTGITANVNVGPVSIFENVLSSNSVTLKTVASLAASYSLTLPSALPGSNNLPIVSSTAGALSFNNQAVTTTSAVVFASLDTGEGANSLYPMNQGVRTTDDVTFNDLNVNDVGVIGPGSGNSNLNQVLNGRHVVQNSDIFTSNYEYYRSKIVDTVYAQYWGARSTSTNKLAAAMDFTGASNSFRWFIGSSSIPLGDALDTASFNQVMQLDANGTIILGNDPQNGGTFENAQFTSVITVNVGTVPGAFPGNYARVGQIVTYATIVEINTDASGEVDLELTLPVASNFSLSTDLSGATSLRKTTTPGTPILMNSAVFANAANNSMQVLVHTATASTRIQIRITAVYIIK